MSEYIMEPPSESTAYWRVHEPIVRCRDCMHMETRTFNDPITGIDAEWFLCSYFNRSTRRDGFCAWGSMK